VTNRAHVAKFYHSAAADVTPSAQLNVIDEIDFRANRESLLEALNKYLGGKQHSKVDPSIRQWVRSLRPVHRCDTKIFESIVSHGQLMARAFMCELDTWEAAAKEAEINSFVRNVGEVTKYVLQCACRGLH
jgi:hypothetical protein